MKIKVLGKWLRPWFWFARVLSSLGIGVVVYLPVGVFRIFRNGLCMGGFIIVGY